MVIHWKNSRLLSMLSSFIPLVGTSFKMHFKWFFTEGIYLHPYWGNASKSKTYINDIASSVDVLLFFQLSFVFVKSLYLCSKSFEQKSVHLGYEYSMRFANPQFPPVSVRPWVCETWSINLQVIQLLMYRLILVSRWNFNWSFRHVNLTHFIFLAFLSYL